MIEETEKTEKTEETEETEEPEMTEYEIDCLFFGKRKADAYEKKRKQAETEEEELIWENSEKTCKRMVEEDKQTAKKQFARLEEEAEEAEETVTEIFVDGARWFLSDNNRIYDPTVFTGNILDIPSSIGLYNHNTKTILFDKE